MYDTPSCFGKCSIVGYLGIAILGISGTEDTCR